MIFFRKIFTWWHDSTIGAQLATWRGGKLVGRDAQGNTYYHSPKNTKKRWVLYKGIIEPTRIPVAWHIWLHNMNEQSPAELGEESAMVYRWQKIRSPNVTGTRWAYYPQGSLLKTGNGVSNKSNYKLWNPAKAQSKSVLSYAYTHVNTPQNSSDKIDQ